MPTLLDFRVLRWIFQMAEIDVLGRSAVFAHENHEGRASVLPGLHRIDDPDVPVVAVLPKALT